MICRFCLAAFIAGLVCAQPAFEVASIRPSNPQEMAGGSGCKTGDGLLRCNNVTLKRCIMGAYRIGPNSISGGPDWIDADRFEIEAKADQPVGDGPLMTLLQGLLGERFALQLHHEQRREEVLALETEKGGPKLESAAEGQRASTNSRRGIIEARSISMDRLAEVLSRQLDEPVVNQTGINGAFDLKLQWTPERPPSPGQSEDPGVSIYSAIHQLGLTLKSKRMPVEVLVIDHVEKPTPN